MVCSRYRLGQESKQMESQHVLVSPLHIEVSRLIGD